MVLFAQVLLQLLILAGHLLVERRNFFLELLVVHLKLLGCFAEALKTLRQRFGREVRPGLRQGRFWR